MFLGLKSLIYHTNLIATKVAIYRKLFAMRTRLIVTAKLEANTRHHGN